jgi:hypothetical protein
VALLAYDDGVFDADGPGQGVAQSMLSQLFDVIRIGLPVQDDATRPHFDRQVADPAAGALEHDLLQVESLRQDGRYHAQPPRI